MVGYWIMPGKSKPRQPTPTILLNILHYCDYLFKVGLDFNVIEVRNNHAKMIIEPGNGIHMKRGRQASPKCELSVLVSCLPVKIKKNNNKKKTAH